MSYLIHITYASGFVRTLTFPAEVDRNFFAILVKDLPVSVQLEDVVVAS